MTKIFNPARLRGFAVARADASNPTAILNEMKKAFEDFKAERNKEVADLKNGLGDYVQTDKVERINAEITSLQKSLDAVNMTISALQIGGAGGGATTPEVSEHTQAFNKWFRKGDHAIEAGLRDLEVKAALTTSSDEDGGYVLPEETSETIDRVVGPLSVMRDISQVMQISGDTYKKLISMGGTGSGWVGEKDERPETETPTLRELVFNMQEIYANPAATQKMLDDARVDIAQWLGNEVATEFAEQEGAAFISGNGVSRPRGILSYDTVANASYQWGKLGYVPSGKAAGFADVTSSVSPADALIDSYFALKQQYRNGASWLMSDATMGTVRKFKDGDGNFIFQLPQGIAELPTILNKPVRNDDNMDAVAAGKFPIAFGNFQRGYLIVDRFGIRVLRDPYTNKPYVHFYTTKRVGGGVQNFEAIKLLKIGTS